jgi:competence protein ComEC
MILWVALCYLLVAFFLLWKKKRPFVLLCCGIIGLCLALVCSWMEPLLDSSRITVLDVGQGQSILLQAEGKNFLIDCGGDRDTAAADIAAETLLSMGIYRLDGVIVTHYDTDHAGGVSKLLYRVPSLAVYLPRYTEDPEIQQEIIQASQGNAYYVEEDFTLSWDNSELTVYAPVSDASANESGLCVLFHGEKCDILVTGDIGIEAENGLILQKNIPELTVLLAGHHGSKYSTGAALLSETMPQYVFISVGADNTYGHPSGEVLDRLSQYGCQVYRTDQNGTIIFRR